MNDKTLSGFAEFMQQQEVEPETGKTLAREAAEDVVEGGVGGLHALGATALHNVLDLGGFIARETAESPTLGGPYAAAVNKGIQFTPTALSIGASLMEMIGEGERASALRGLAGGIESVDAALPDLTPEQIAESIREYKPQFDQFLADNYTGRHTRPEWAQPDTYFGGFVEGVAQFLPYYQGAAAAQPVARLLGGSAVQRVTGAAAAGAVADFAGFPGNEGRLSDFAAKHGWDNFLVNALKSEEGDSEFTGRLKNALEGLVIGPFVDGLFEAGGRALRGAPLTPEEVRAGRERGELPPELDAAYKIDWQDASNDLTGPERARFWESAEKAGVGSEEIEANQILTDTVAARWAEATGKTVDDFYKEKLGSINEFGELIPDTDALNQLDPAKRDVASAFVSSLGEDKSLGRAVLDGSAPRDLVKPSGANGRVTVGDIGAAADELYRLQFGEGGGLKDPATRERGLRLMRDELDAIINGADDTGLQWYSGDAANAWKLTGEIHPEVLTDPHLRVQSSIVAGILSNGINVEKNWDQLIDAIQYYKENGSWPAVNPVNGKGYNGPRGPNVQKAVELYNHILHEVNGGDPRAMTDWLLKDHSVRELNEIRVGSGVMSTKLTEVKLNDMVPGFRMFGPKIGNFGGKLGGADSPQAVIDTWATRTGGRVTGSMTEGSVSKQTGIVDSPSREMREYLDESFQTLADEVGTDKHAIQAALWYNEQRLFTALGVPSESESFADAARKALDKRGIPVPDTRPSVRKDDAVDGGRNGESLDQQARGRVTFGTDGRAVIQLFESSDASTLTHELSHVFRRTLNEIDPELQARADKFVGAKPGAKWTRAQEEKWATSWETYLQNGKAPSDELQGAFDTMKRMLTEVYQAILAKGTYKVKPEIRDVFDQLLAGPTNRANPASKTPSTRTPNRPLPAVQQLRDSYYEKTGVQPPKQHVYARVHTDLAARVADEYEKLVHNPSDPAVRESYAALADETLAQYEHVTESGTRFVFTTADPYASSQALVDDIETNNRMYVFLTEPGSLPKGHPLGKKTGIKVTDPNTGKEVELVYNDLFRAVHDFFGHAAEGYQFGARGEENAWLLHSRMYSEKARPAMTTETRGQNSWVNTNSKIRRSDGSLPKRGDSDFVEPTDRPFAEQKAALLPDWAMEHPDVQVGSRDASFGSRVKATADALMQSGMPTRKALDTAVATHTNFDKLETTDDAIAMILQIEEWTQKQIDDLIGSTETLEEVAAEAAQRGLDPVVLTKNLREASTDVQGLAGKIVAGRRLKIALAERAADLATSLEAAAEKKAVTPEMERGVVDAINALAKVDIVLGVITKEAARATGSGRIRVPGLDEDLVDGLLAHLKDPSSPKDEALTAAINAAVARGDQELANALQAGGESKRVARINKVATGLADAQRVGAADKYVRRLRGTKDPTLLDAFLEVYKAGLLSGLRTVSINIGSGGIQTYLQAVARTIGAGARFGTASGRQDFREAAEFLVHLHGSMADVAGMLALNRQLTKGYTPDVRASLKRSVAQESPNLYGSYNGGGLAASATESKKAFVAQTFGASDDSVIGKGINGLGRVIRLPYLANMLGEEWWSQVNYLASVRTKAMAEARSELGDVLNDPKLTPAQKAVALGDYVDSYVENSFDEFGSAARRPDGSYEQVDAVRYAKSANFMQDLEHGVGQWLLEGKDKFPLLDLLIPFIKAPTNLFRTSLRYAGLGGVESRLAKKAGVKRAQWEIDKNRGEAVLGGVLMTFAGYMAANGRMTGGGPVNADEREALEATGWKPYSFVRVGEDGRKEYISYSRFDPQASVFGIVSDIVELMPYMSTNEQDQVIKGSLSALAQNFSSKTYMRGLSDALQAVMVPDRYGKKYVFNLAANSVPFSSFGRSFNQASDDTMREVYTLMDAVKQRVPGMSDSLPPRRNIFGEPITPMGGYIPFTSGETAVGKMASPAAFSRESSDAAIQEMARLQVGFSMPSREIDTVDLTLYTTPSGQNAYDRYLELTGEIRLSGRSVKDAVNQLVASPAYRRLPEPTGEARVDRYNPRVKEIQDVLRTYREAAKKQLKQEIPEIGEEIRRRKVSGASGQVSSPGNGLSVIDRLLSK